VLYSSYTGGGGGGAPATGHYDLLFFSLVDGSFIRQIYVYSNNFDVSTPSLLFFYNTKVYFFMRDDVDNRIGFYIWNEGDIASITIGPSMTLNQIDDTGNFDLIGFAKGSISSNYLILSTA
jgi:hypothetical protein